MQIGLNPTILPQLMSGTPPQLTDLHAETRLDYAPTFYESHKNLMLGTSGSLALGALGLLAVKKFGRGIKSIKNARARLASANLAREMAINELVSVLQKQTAQAFCAYDTYIPNSCVNNVLGLMRSMSHELFCDETTSHVRVLIIKPLNTETMQHEKGIFIRDTRPKYHVVLTIGRRVYDFDYAGNVGEDIETYLKNNFGSQNIGIVGMSATKAILALKHIVLASELNTFRYMPSQDILNQFNETYPEMTQPYDDIAPRGQKVMATYFAISRARVKNITTYDDIGEAVLDQLTIPFALGNTKGKTLEVVLFLGDNLKASDVNKKNKDHIRRYLEGLVEHLGLKEVKLAWVEAKE